MCPSRLPNDVTSYRPSGMLDRDQRTAFTIHRIRDGPTTKASSITNSTTITTITTTNTTTSSSGLNYRNSRPNSNHLQCNNSSVNTVDKEAKEDLFEGYNLRCKCDCQQINDGGTLWQDSNMASNHLSRKYTTTSGYYRSRTKFVNYLLVFICIWLASVHQTFAYPAAMSGENNQDPDAQRCRTIRDALNKPIEQARIASQYIRGLLDDYTQAQFKKQPIEVHEEWRKHPPHFSYGTSVDIAKYLPEDFDGEPPESNFEHLLGEGVPSENELSIEFQRIYVYLQSLKQVFYKILNDRKANASQILHQLNNDRKTHEAINHLFEEQFRYSNLDITEIETAMTALQIPYPELGEVTIAPKFRPIGEWIATREYLKLLSYIREVYRILLKRCS